MLYIRVYLPKTAAHKKHLTTSYTTKRNSLLVLSMSEIAFKTITKCQITEKFAKTQPKFWSTLCPGEINILHATSVFPNRSMMTISFSCTNHNQVQGTCTKRSTLSHSVYLQRNCHLGTNLLGKKLPIMAQYKLVIASTKTSKLYQFQLNCCN